MIHIARGSGMMRSREAVMRGKCTISREATGLCAVKCKDARETTNFARQNRMMRDKTRRCAAKHNHAREMALVAREIIKMRGEVEFCAHIISPSEINNSL